MLYQASKNNKDESWLDEARKKFTTCKDKDEKHRKAKRALEKLAKKDILFYQSQRTIEKIGALIILFLSIFVFGVAQCSFIASQFNQPEKTTNTVEAVSKSNQPQKSTNTVEPLEQSNYTLLTFGSLIFMVIALYLPQLLPQLSKLKVAGVELEKSAVDQIKTSGDFGLERQASAVGKLETSKQLGSSGKPDWKKNKKTAMKAEKKIEESKLIKKDQDNTLPSKGGSSAKAAES